MQSVWGDYRLLVAVVGGGLQGVEAAYLAHKAGWNVRIVDKNSQAPAAGLCDSFVHVDVTAEGNLPRILNNVDLVIPALEDDDALACLNHWCRSAGVPFTFDPDAYAVSSSKLESDKLFNQMGLPRPSSWPDCSFPVIAKPSKGSGSRGLKIFYDAGSLKRYFSQSFPPQRWVLQEYLEGSLHSLEIMGMPGNYRALQVTDLFVDTKHDCQRVVAPTKLSAQRVVELETLSLQIADALNLHGIMDVEVLLHQGRFKILEIDARLPSQTPTAVYWSTGQNIVQLLAQLFTDNFTPTLPDTRAVQGVVYEHICVSSDRLYVNGEHIMTQGGPLFKCQNFFGADEALTNYHSKKDQWVATLIISEKDRCSALAKRDRIIDAIRKRFSLKKGYDEIAID